MKFAQYNFLSTVLLQLALFSFSTFALPAKEEGLEKRISPNISPAMKKVTIDSDVFQPDTNPAFLQQAIYYGGERFVVAADGLFQQVLGWGLGLTTIQLPLNEVHSGQIKGNDYIPGSPVGYYSQWKDGAYGMAYSCQKYGKSVAKKMNEGCQNCGKTYFLGLAWGTLNGMNFDKDGVLIGGCSVLEVINSDPCFANFPNGCSIRAVGETIDLWNEKPRRIAINSKSRVDIIAAIKKYSASTHQNIAVPNA